MDEEAVPDGEYYRDALTGRPRRKRSRGPMSAAEEKMCRQWSRWRATVRLMNGELQDATCNDMTRYLAMLTSAAYDWRREAVHSVRGVDPHVVFEQVGFVVEDNRPVEGDFDLGNLQ